MIGPYDTPQAFLTALEAWLRNIARQEGTDLQRLQRRGEPIHSRPGCQSPHRIGPSLTPIWPRSFDCLR